MHEVYINKLASFLPNDPVCNDSMEDYLGFINGKKSKIRSLILRSNGIKQRYYALDKNGCATHTNATLVAQVVKKIFDSNPQEIASVDLLTCGTTSPDTLLPSHAVMVHGQLPEMGSAEVVSHAGACCSGMHAFKQAYLSVKDGEKNKAVCCGSERISPMMKAQNFDAEIKAIAAIEKNPYIAFEKDFLRWMLSDGAGAFLLENKKNDNSISLKVEWIDIISFANKLNTCMYMGAHKSDDGDLISYHEMTAEEIANLSVMSLKQDVKILSENIVETGFGYLIELLNEKQIGADDIDYFLPHISSYFFQPKIFDFMKKAGFTIPYKRWFLNLENVGNIGAGSIYVMLDELLRTKPLEKGQKILLVVPESARFSYAFALLTVC